MTFEMGAAAAAVETRLRSGGQLESPLCRETIGVTVEDLRFRRRAPRTYVFAREDWTAPRLRSVMELLP